MKDPRVRKDGSCYICKGTRPVVAVTHSDPFCRSACAREFHGLDERGKKKEAA